ncbi:hypothetical protein [Chryseobacterium daeguense]|uniref:hypothetical protein n=1 Tax=Chryseobacterium daeguense TaxID=412438 RepID=UPI00041DAD28|nr:hypothetical protein [Chryseobacterium daeguense]
MKKFLPILLLAFVSLFIFSCDDDDNNNNFVDHDTYSQMRDATGTFSSSNSYTLSMDINILNTDVVLVYRKVGGYWESIPKTYYLDNVTVPATGRELDYSFDFNTQEVNIRTSANFNQSTMSSAEANQYLNNQTFRVVLVPASAAKNTASVDTSDYNAVVKYYNLDESKIKTIKIN